MAGGLTAAFLSDLLEGFQNATGAPATIFPGTDMWINLYGTTLNDTVVVGTTGRLGDAFQVEFDNTTGTWTLAAGTSPISIQNKTTITVTTAASATGSVQAGTLSDTSSTSSQRIFAYFDVDPTQVVSTGNTLSFATGTLVITIGGGTTT